MYPRDVMQHLLTVAALLQVQSAAGTRVLPGLSYLPPRPDNTLIEASRRPSGSPSVPDLPSPSFPLPTPSPPSDPSSQRPPTVIIPFPNDTPSFQTSPGSGVIPFPHSSVGFIGPEAFDPLPPLTSAGCPEACTRNYEPLCGTDGITYNNKCLLDIAICKGSTSGLALGVAFEGTCVPRNAAIFIAAMPSSDAVGLTSPAPEGSSQYGNQNEPSVSTSFSSQSSCPEACTKEFTPVCGSDDQTYNNECILNVAACKSRSAEGDVLFKAFEGPCVAALPRGPVCDQACDKTFLPVCGSDGETYNNICLLNLADCFNPFVSITYASDGPCESKSAAGLSIDPRPSISTEPRPSTDTGSFQSSNPNLSAATEQEYLPPV